MKNGRLKLVAPPTQEPVKLEEMKEYMSLDESFDNTILELLQAGREAVEEYQNRATSEQTFELVFDYFPSCFEIPRPPFIEIVSIKYYDLEGTEHIYDSSNFIIDDSGQLTRIILKYGITIPITQLQSLRGFVLTYKAGYANIFQIPAKTKQAIKLYVTWHFDNRDGTSDNLEFERAFHSLLNANRVINI